jgi:hypothetical protein
MLDVLNGATEDEVAQWARMVGSRNYRRLPQRTYELDGS